MTPALLALLATSGLRSRLLAATTRHLDLLLQGGDAAVALRGKSADGQEALAFRLAFEATGDARYRRAALALADGVLKELRATKFGVTGIKTKAKRGGDPIEGGGPPAWGFAVADVGYVLHQEGGRGEDLRYLASILDRFPWNEKGWWAADIDVATGESKVPMTKPAPVNKTASVALAAGMLGAYVRGIDPTLSASLRRKTDACLYGQILPAQGADGFWNYSLSGKDPGNKDVLATSC